MFKTLKAKILAALSGAALAGVVFAASAGYYGWNPATGLEVLHGSVVGGGTPLTLTGCATISNSVGGASGGSFNTSGTSCALVITFPSAAPNGWYCAAQDLTTPADTVKQNASTTTSCTFAGTTVANDLIAYEVQGY
jgi:hypothetical protein